jgi:hypothetical protein
VKKVARKVAKDVRIKVRDVVATREDAAIRATEAATVRRRNQRQSS